MHTECTRTINTPNCFSQTIYLPPPLPLLLHELLMPRRPLRPPPAQRRPSLGQVSRRPRDASPVDLLRDVVVRANDVELAPVHALRQPLGDLVRRPRALRFRASPPAARQARVGPSGHQQVHRDRRFTQIEREVLGQRFDRRLGRVVAGVRRRVGDALLTCFVSVRGQGRRRSRSRLTPDDNNCAGGGIRPVPQYRQELSDAVQHTIYIRLEQLPRSNQQLPPPLRRSHVYTPS